jgi:hyaluronate lyase
MRCVRAGLVVGLVIVFGTPAGLARAADDAQAAAELKQIRDQTVAQFTLSAVPKDSPLLKAHVGLMDDEVGGLLRGDGQYWKVWTSVEQPDISMGARAFLRPMRLAMAYATPASKYYHSKPVLAAVEGGLRHLSTFAYADCPEPRNWWAWQIGMPSGLIPTLLLTQGDLDAKLWADELKTVEYLLRDRPGGKDCETGLPKTDMNSLWYLRLRFELAVLKGDAPAARRWATASFRQMAPAGQGAVQADYSHHFHGPDPMWAYGRHFLMEYALLVNRTRGTSLGPTAKELDDYAAMAEHFVNGFCYRGRLSPTMIGREIDRGDEVYHTPYGLLAAAGVASSSHPRAAEFARIVAREKAYYTGDAGLSVAELLRQEYANPQSARMLAVLLAGVPAAEPAPAVDDVFAYPDSDYLQVTRPNFAVGIKMHSKRTRSFESINGENLQGWFLSHGTMFPMITGDEWTGCWPTLDWTRLPGTTAAVNVKGRNANSSPFVGVLRGSEKVALAAMEITAGKSGEFHARKSWLVSGDSILCLGSDIRGPGRVETTVINQPVADEKRIAIDGKPLPSRPFSGRMAVRQIDVDGMTYVLPDRPEVMVSYGPRTSNWSSIRSEDIFGKTKPVTHWYLTVVIEHSASQPTYAYVMGPTGSKDVATAAALTRNVSKGSHFVRSGDGQLEAAVLWEAGAAGAVQDATSPNAISADAGCMLLRSGGAWQVVDPAWSGKPVKVHLAGHDYEAVSERGRAVTLK